MNAIVFWRIMVRKNTKYANKDRIQTMASERRSVYSWALEVCFAPVRNEQEISKHSEFDFTR